MHVRREGVAIPCGRASPHGTRDLKKFVRLRGREDPACPKGIAVSEPRGGVPAEGQARPAGVGILRDVWYHVRCDIRIPWDHKVRAGPVCVSLQVAFHDPGELTILDIGKNKTF